MSNRYFRVGSKAACDVLGKAEILPAHNTGEGSAWTPLDHAAFSMYRSPTWLTPPLCWPNEPRGIVRRGDVLHMADAVAGECGRDFVATYAAGVQAC